MAVVQLDCLETGMILKANVCDRSGRLLLPAGAELTDKLLKIFRTWGVVEADIVRDQEELSADGSGEDGSVDPLALSEAERTIELQFCRNDSQHPMISELMRVCLQRRLAHGR